METIETCCECIEGFKDSGIWNQITTSVEAYNGHLDCLIYAHENRCPWNEATPSNAATNGHLDCLIYAHENGCPWNDRTISNAAKNGHLECIKYAYENGCPFDEERTLSGLNHYASKIDLDDKWWRSFLFEKDLTTHSILNLSVHTKKEEIKNLQEKSTLLFSNISKDLTKYVLWTYF